MFLPPANVVCEGYVFTRVCQSFCSRGGGGGVHATHTPHYACPLPSCHTCPPPLPCTPPGHVCPSATHTPLPCLPPRHTCLPPLPCIPPGPHMPPPVMHTPCHTCPPAMHPPTTLRHAVNERAVRILLECILVSSKNTHSSQNRFHCRPSILIFLSQYSKVRYVKYKYFKNNHPSGNRQIYHTKICVSVCMSALPVSFKDPLRNSVCVWGGGLYFWTVYKQFLNCIQTIYDLVGAR